MTNFAKHRSILAQLAKGLFTIPTPRGLQEIYASTLELHVGKVIVIPQPLGGLRAHSGLQTEADNAKQSLVVDVGFNTFDWLIAKGSRPDMERSGSFEGGVSQLIREVSTHAGNELGIGALDFLDTEKALATGQLSYKGKVYPFTKYRDIADAAATSVVNKFINAQKGNRGFDKIILTGGGAVFFEKALKKRFPSFELNLGADAVMDNVRGFYSFGFDLIK